jgi:hypothetical protein
MAMGQGTPRTPARLAELLRQARFGDVRSPRTHQPMLARLLVARASD